MHVQISLHHPKGACPAYSNIFPAVPKCQRHIKPSKVTRSSSLGCDGKHSLRKKIFLDLHQKPEQQVQGIIMVKQRRSSSSLQRNYLPSDNGFTVLQCFFPQDIIMCFTSLNYCSHKSNAFRTLKCSHLGLSLQLYSDGVEGSGFCR